MHLKRLRRRETRTPRYLTFSCHRRLPLLGTPAWRGEFARSLAAARERCGFRLLAWVALPEHAHLVIVPGPAPVPEILRAIKQPVAQRALRRWRASNAAVMPHLSVGERSRFWQAGGGFDRNCRDAGELAKTTAYIHENPVRRGLAQHAEDWAWSSARWYAGQREGELAIDAARW